jgi:hypothetical protein
MYIEPETRAAAGMAICPVSCAIAWCSALCSLARCSVASVLGAHRPVLPAGFGFGVQIQRRKTPDADAAPTAYCLAHGTRGRAAGRKAGRPPVQRRGAGLPRSSAAVGGRGRAGLPRSNGPRCRGAAGDRPRKAHQQRTCPWTLLLEPGSLLLEDTPGVGSCFGLVGAT